MRPDALFAYGTLLFPEVFEAVTGRQGRGAEAVLTDWAALRVRGEVYPGRRRAAGARTPGRVYAGLDPETWARLDAFEGELYELAVVEVACQDRLCRAGVYAIAESHQGRLSAERWNAPRLLDADGLRAILISTEEP